MQSKPKSKTLKSLDNIKKTTKSSKQPEPQQQQPVVVQKETNIQSLQNDIITSSHEDFIVSFSGEIQIHVVRAPTVGEGELVADESMLVISREDLSREQMYRRKIDRHQITRVSKEGTAMLMAVLGIIGMKEVEDEPKSKPKQSTAANKKGRRPK